MGRRRGPETIVALWVFRQVSSDENWNDMNHEILVGFFGDPYIGL